MRRHIEKRADLRARTNLVVAQVGVVCHPRILVSREGGILNRLGEEGPRGVSHGITRRLSHVGSGSQNARAGIGIDRDTRPPIADQTKKQNRKGSAGEHMSTG